MSEAGISEVTSAACETPLTNVFTYRIARTLPKDLLEMAARKAEMFRVMRPFMPPPPSPAPPSPFEWGNADRVRALLAGDFELRFEQGVATYFDRDGAATWDAFVTGYGPTKALARSLDDSRRVELKQAFIAFHDAYRTELGITVPREYLITLGKRK